MNQVFDKRGIPIRPGDVLKVFHFVAALRREKQYLYKFVESEDGKFLKVGHLLLRHPGGWYPILLDNKIHPEIEIVQGYGTEKEGLHYRDRKRVEVKKKGGGE